MEMIFNAVATSAAARIDNHSGDHSHHSRHSLADFCWFDTAQVMVHQRDRTADIVAHVNLGKLSMIDLAGASEKKN